MDSECPLYRILLTKKRQHDGPVNCSNVEPEDGTYLFSCYLRAAFTFYLGRRYTQGATVHDNFRRGGGIINCIRFKSMVCYKTWKARCRVHLPAVMVPSTETYPIKTIKGYGNTSAEILVSL